MIMCKVKEKFYNWLGMKLYNGSEQFKNTICGIYYEDMQLPNIKKINDLVEENMLLKLKLNVAQNTQEKQVIGDASNQIPVEKPAKKKRKYTKRKKEVKE